MALISDSLCLDRVPEQCDCASAAAMRRHPAGAAIAVGMQGAGFHLRTNRAGHPVRGPHTRRVETPGSTNGLRDVRCPCLQSIDLPSQKPAFGPAETTRCTSEPPQFYGNKHLSAPFLETRQTVFEACYFLLRKEPVDQSSDRTAFPRRSTCETRYLVPITTN